MLWRDENRSAFVRNGSAKLFRAARIAVEPPAQRDLATGIPEIDDYYAELASKRRFVDERELPRGRGRRAA